MEPYRKLVQHWSAQGLTIVGGVSEEAMREFEIKYGVTMSSDPEFRDYLFNVDGLAQIGGQDCDEKGFAFWPLERMKNVPEECAARKVEAPRIDDVGGFVSFADYMQWSWAYAICLSPSQKGKVLQFGTRSPRIIADSFSEFVEAYLVDSGELYLPD